MTDTPESSQKFTIYLDHVIDDPDERRAAARQLAAALEVSDVEKVYKLLSKAPRKLSKAMPKAKAKEMALACRQAGLTIKIKKEASVDSVGAQESTRGNSGSALGRGASQRRKAPDYNAYSADAVSANVDPAEDNPYVREYLAKKQNKTASTTRKVESGGAAFGTVGKGAGYDGADSADSADGAFDSYDGLTVGNLPRPQGSGFFFGNLPPVAGWSLAGVQHSVYIQSIIHPEKVFWHLHSDYPANAPAGLTFWYAVISALSAGLISAFSGNPGLLFGSMLGVPVAFIGMLISLYLGGFFLHWVGKTFFGGQGEARDLRLSLTVVSLASCLLNLLPTTLLTPLASLNSVFASSFFGVLLGGINLIASIWLMVVSVRAFKEAHRFTSMGKAIGAWLAAAILPAVLVGALVFLSMGFFTLLASSAR